MQGIVNAAHWAAFALVVASVARTWADWVRLLNANLAVGLAVSVFAVVRFAAPETPLPFPFTGIDDPWEAPERADLAVDTAGLAPDAAARRVLETLERLGYVRGAAR